MAAFTVKELTFAGLFLGLLIVTVVPLFRGGLIPLRHHREVVDMMSRQIEVERSAKEDAQAAAKELLMQNSLLLRKDDVATAALTSIREMVERHEGEDAGP